MHLDLTKHPGWGDPNSLHFLSTSLCSAVLLSPHFPKSRAHKSAVPAQKHTGFVSLTLQFALHPPWLLHCSTRHHQQHRECCKHHPGVAANKSNPQIPSWWGWNSGCQCLRVGGTSTQSSWLPVWAGKRINGWEFELPPKLSHTRWNKTGVNSSAGVLFKWILPVSGLWDKIFSLKILNDIGFVEEVENESELAENKFFATLPMSLENNKWHFTLWEPVNIIYYHPG